MLNCARHSFLVSLSRHLHPFAMLSAPYARSKWYSSITTPTPRRPRSSKLRTTRPWQSIWTLQNGSPRHRPEAGS
jgi:hypothetical protein